MTPDVLSFDAEITKLHAETIIAGGDGQVLTAAHVAALRRLHGEFRCSPSLELLNLAAAELLLTTALAVLRHHGRFADPVLALLDVLASDVRTGMDARRS